MLSRRQLLAGAASSFAMAAGGCSPKLPSAEAPAPPSAEMVERAVREASDALASGRWERLSPHLGDSPDPAWRQLLGIVAPDSLSVQLVPRLESMRTQSGGAELSGQLRHRLPTADDLEVAQPVTITLSRSGPDALVTKMAFDTSTALMPWNVGPVATVQTDHLFIVHAVPVAEVLHRALPDIEATCAAIYREVPEHRGPRRTVCFVGREPAETRVWEGGGPIDAFGYATSVGTVDGRLVWRVAAFNLPPDGSELARTLRHEVVHALAGSWAPASVFGTEYVVEGIAYWAQAGYAEGLLADIRRLDLVDPALVTPAARDHLSFVDTDDASRAVGQYVMQASFHAWLETLLGRRETWLLARECYLDRAPERTYPKALGLADERSVFEAWAAWLTPQLT